MESEVAATVIDQLSAGTSNRSLLAVLIIDDQSHVRTFSRKILERAGITNVTEAGDGREALAAVTQPGAWFDLILCDLRMPDRDGVETIRAFAALGLESAVAILSMEPERVVEGAGRLANVQGLRMLGTIQKPLSVEKLEPIFARMFELPSAAPVAAAMASEGDLANAFTRKELRLVFQPQVQIRSGKLAGVEALLRWRHPELGLLAPDAFVPAMEQHEEFGRKLMDFSIAGAMSLAARWHEAGRPLQVSMNLPARAFERLDLPERLEDMAREARVPPSSVTLEMMESLESSNDIKTIDIATRLRLKNFSLTIDRFGTLASGRAMVDAIPFDGLKIDPLYVIGCASSGAKRSVVETSLALARSLKLTSVAEGVQERPDWNLLESLGCDVVQGAFIARPMNEEGLDAWAAQWMLK
jgi:EAL domain-containing protein (putative c-di-GMP-specific phosphodiesterase class I)